MQRSAFSDTNVFHLPFLPDEIMLVIECFFSLCSAAQSYDNGFGQGAGRESHGEYHHLLSVYSWLQISDPHTRQPRFKSLSYGDH